MKKAVLLIYILNAGCSAAKPDVNNAAALQGHPKPIKIFGIGYGKPGYTVLTLVDANKEYFTITTKQDENLKVGGQFDPKNEEIAPAMAGSKVGGY